MFANLKTGTKILVGFAAGIAISLAVGGVGFWSASTIAAHLEEITNERLPDFSDTRAILEGQEVVVARLSTLLHAAFTDPAARKALAEDATAALGRMDEARKHLEAASKSEALSKLWAKFDPVYTPWRAAAQRVAANAAERDSLLSRAVPETAAEAAALRERSWKDFTALQAANRAIDDVVDPIAQQVQKELDEAKADGLAGERTGKRVMVVAILLGALVMLALGALMARAISGVIRALIAEAAKLSSAVEEGTLDVRGDAESLTPEFRPVVEGMNRTMDAFARPIELTQDYVVRISRGEIPAPITDRYEGDFDKIKQALNQCIAAVGLLVQDANSLAQAAVEGKLQTRAEAQKHQGDFRRIVEGVNHTLDSVVAPINEAQQVLEKLAARDLTARVQGNYQGDHARIKQAINAAGEALHQAMAQVAEAVEQVSAAAGQIASSSQAVASGASEQASSLEETHSSLESMSAQTRQAADSAVQANTLASGTQASAQQGASSMEQMTSAMGKIRRSAEGTSAIIKDISEIAFQTNLLALNAAVEAARAGEAGRGFAVVAEEVRSLALRAKEAAVKTEDLIKQSVSQASEGEAIAKEASGKLGEIVGNAQKVSDIVAEIASSAKEQAQGIEQINRAVGEMDKVTQQNAANSEESSSAAEELSSQSEELAAMVGSFKTKRASGGDQGKPASGPSIRKAPARLVRPASAGRANGKPNGSNGIALRPEELIPLEGDHHLPDF